MDPHAAAVDALRDTRRLLVLSGAGLSTESGIPDFRSPGGLWTRLDPRDFQYERYLHDPKGFWTLRARLMAELALDKIQPNPAHHALARASHNPRLLGHITQNIDGLLQRASHHPHKLIEIHGNAHTLRCLACATYHPPETARTALETNNLPPRCPTCQGPLKPGTILFGEPLHPPDLHQAQTWTHHADTLLILGTSLQVHPTATLPATALQRGARLIIHNATPTPYDHEAHAILRTPLSTTLPTLLADAGYL